MANISLRRSKRAAVKLKLGISGASGSGKTMSSLLLAYGLIKAQHPTLSDDEIWEKICVIDTENKSADLYSGHQVGRFRIGEFMKIDLSAPFTPEKYEDAIDCCQENGIEFCIIDSLTHAWAGEGGLLDKQARIASTGKNSYTAWRDVTPQHNRLVDKLLQCDMHIIAALRTKTDYVLEEDGKGKKVPKKIGLAPIFRDGIEYEFTVMMDVAGDHYVTASKDRTGLFDGQSFIITPDTGKKINEWLNSGAPVVEKPKMQTAEPVAHASPVAPVSTVITGDVPAKKAPVEESPDIPDTPIVEAPMDDEPPFDMEDDLDGGDTAENAEISLEDFVDYIKKVIREIPPEDKTKLGNLVREYNNGSAKYKEITDGAIRMKIYNELQKNNWRA